MQYSVLHSAIIVLPDYRMLPEANGLDIMKDLSDFWEWVYTGLSQELGAGIEIGFGKILIEGGSAGSSSFTFTESWLPNLNMRQEAT